MDFENYIVCGLKDGDLKCPADSSDGKELAVYDDFLQTVERFRQLQALPVELAYSGCDTAVELLENHAKWHKACKLEFASSKPKGARDRHKRKSTEQDERKSKRQKHESSSTMKDCIFCRKTQGKLHSCSALGLDKTLREMATTLEGKDLLARMAVGDLIAIEARYQSKCPTAFKIRYRRKERKKQGHYTTSTIDQKM